MFLKTISYYEYRDKPNFWEIKTVNLGKINLVVGLNATGKTRLLNVINNLAKILTKKAKFSNGNWNLEFLDNGQHLVGYELKILAGIIENESITKDKKILLTRKGEKGQIYSTTQERLIPFSPPNTELTLHSRRDRIEHGFLEEIYDWANSVYGYAFTNISTNQIAVPNPDRPDDMLENLGSVPFLLTEALSQYPDIVNKIISDFAKVGYASKSISTIKTLVPGIAGGVPLISVQEANLRCQTGQMVMSQGMYRALSLLIIIEFIIMKNKPCTVAIDDLGEGLDYDRSAKLVDLLFRKIEKSHIQLIITSNDRFLINATDLRCVNLLERKGHVVKAYNYENSKGKFERFELSGLSTFDFFAKKIYKSQN